MSWRDLYPFTKKRETDLIPILEKNKNKTKQKKKKQTNKQKKNNQPTVILKFQLMDTSGV
jgi:hypothetical protein